MGEVALIVNLSTLDKIPTNALDTRLKFWHIYLRMRYKSGSLIIYQFASSCGMKIQRRDMRRKGEGELRNREGVVMAIIFVLAFSAAALAAEPATLISLNAEAGGNLFLAVPPDGRERDSLLVLDLRGEPRIVGFQHGLLLSANIARVIRNRYACVPPDILRWVEEAYEKMPRESREEIRGIADGLRAKEYAFPFATVVLHATQPLVGLNFSWFLCPWEEPAGLAGSFSYWRRYAQNIFAISSPDFGSVPKSLANSTDANELDDRVLVIVHPNAGIPFAYLGVAGVIGMPGMNVTGLSIAGTSGPVGIVVKTPMPENRLSIPNGFMTPFMLARYALQYISGDDPQAFDRFEDLLKRNPIDGFISHLSTPRGSMVWESGAAASPDYPANSRRAPGEWDSGNITPVDWRGKLALTQDGIFNVNTLPFPVRVDSVDSNGEPYSGVTLADGHEYPWRRWQLGRAFHFAPDDGRSLRFANWFANLGTAPADAPIAIKDDGRRPDSIVSVFPDKSGGFWITADGTIYGSWRREGDDFRSFFSDGRELCFGPLYDFGNGVAGWCRMNDTDIEWVAWTYRYPDGAFERLDASNIALLPAIKPLYGAGHPLYGGPHSRTHSFLRELGAAQDISALDEFYKIFQRAYLAVGGENQPFGVGVYDLIRRDAMFTVGRYEGGRYIGGLNPEQKPIFLNRAQMFGR